ncbi:MAG TPA: delta-60 repeat domain-containing protein, partial [Tahibacter sp.]|nr:delta-60 repeat domain-containing protein [Tahibacter sp.]
IAFEAGRYETANAIALQSDGRIVLAGSVGIGAHADVAIARLTADGDLDATFGNWLPGRSVGGFDALLNDSANAVAIGELRADPAGTRRIVVAGTAQAFDGTTGAALAVFDDAGELDPGFSGDGRRTIGTGTGDGWRAVGVLIETTTVAGHPTPTQSRRIVLGIDASNARDGFRLARFAFDGNLDAGFGIAGIGHWQADLDRDGVPNEASLVDIARHGAGVVLLGTTRVHEPDDALDRDFVLVRATLGQ